MSNTLFKYFTKSPRTDDDNMKETESSNKQQETPKGKKASSSPNVRSNKKQRSSEGKFPKAKKPRLDESEKGSTKKDCKENKTPNAGDGRFLSESEDESPEKKRRLSLLESDGSEDEYKPESDHADESSESESGVESCAELSSGSASERESTPPPKKAGKKNTTRSSSDSRQARGKRGETSFQSSVTTPKAKAKLSSSSIATPSTPTGIESHSPMNDKVDNYAHLKFEFLKPDKIRDGKKRKPNDPNYDPRTLYIPEDFKKDLTPAHKQWWDMKATHYDCVLFFKVGKFYELFHMDAVTGVNELNLSYMKGDFAHSGFPEIAFGRFATILVEKGYKVARIEQTETVDMMERRCKTIARATKFDRVVRREICQITTKGTRVFSVVDGDTKEAESAFLLAVVEKKFDSGGSAYGVCFVDTSIGEFNLGQFIDYDKQCSGLRTLIAHYPPSQVLYERGQVSQKTQQVLNITLAAVMKEALVPDTEFWGSSKTLLRLSEAGYFGDDLPEPLKYFLGDGDSVGLTAGEDGELAVRSLGAVTWYLRRCQLDHRLLSMKKFNVYISPSSTTPCPALAAEVRNTAKHMILDAVTLRNLHVLENSLGGKEGTLLEKLDNCNTPFGKRLLFQWICSPLNNMGAIASRQRAISVLMENVELIEEVKQLMSQLPDLERLLSRIFAQSTFGSEASHPENRAVMYEEKTYSKKKIVEFTNALSGFETVQKIAKTFQGSGVGNNSDLLRQCTHFTDHPEPGQLPNLADHLKFFKMAFDHEEALKEGRIIPSAGVDTEYDNAESELEAIARQLKTYLEEQSAYFGCKVTYVGTDKKRFQLEMNEQASRKAGSSYELQGQRKGFKRYWTPKCKEMLERQIAAEEAKQSVLQDLRRRIFSRFSERMDDWRGALECVSVLDVLLSLAVYSRSEAGDMCLPKFEPTKSNSKAIVDIRSGRYPCSSGGEVFVPNDTTIGGPNEASLVLVTGPNMGGKSTLMRQVGLIVILAQMGCHVPAESVTLSLVDRIFTRLGAQDDIMSGESTFYTELTETSAILKHATHDSLVLIDELGRGTSTYDGTAIAAAVLKELSSSRARCRALFSTHYHSLVEDFKNDKEAVRLGHMACMAENESDNAGNEQETVTFLYKFAEGACPKSYGFNAARLAGVPDRIISAGRRFAARLEQESHNRKYFKNVFRPEGIRNPGSLRSRLEMALVG